MATLEVLIQDVIQRLVMANGTNVQRYAEDRIAAILNEAYIEVFEMRFWQWNTRTTVWALSANTGQVATDISTTLYRFTDIDKVWLDNDPRQLPKLGRRANINTIRAKSYAPSGDAKIFTVWPKPASGNVTVSYRSRADVDFTPEQEVPMDRLALRYKACYDYLVGEGINEEEAAKFLQLYRQRLAKLEELDNAGELLLEDYSQPDLLTDWWAPPYG
jgi:hypothetical protein